MEEKDKMQEKLINEINDKENKWQEILSKETKERKIEIESKIKEYENRIKDINEKYNTNSTNKNKEINE